MLYPLVRFINYCNRQSMNIRFYILLGLFTYCSIFSITISVLVLLSFFLSLAITFLLYKVEIWQAISGLEVSLWFDKFGGYGYGILEYFEIRECGLMFVNYGRERK